jgi:CYTH domain-containing protein
MAVEIERKFLLRSDAWKSTVTASRHLCQFYLSREKRASIRVRIRDDKAASLTIKSTEPGLRRDEFEYAIPLEDAKSLMALKDGTIIEKTRYIVPAESLCWEIDAFSGANEGLIVAEVELATEDQIAALPDWVGDEVTDDPRYQNANLALKPFSEWEL